jgi:rSAM/selenodomain-associated transferase 2/rSAM/selenodomain-associated transferase 1
MSAPASSSRPGRCLVLFTRYPTPGCTKTRLIPRLGARGAADVQRQMTVHVVDIVREFAREHPGHSVHVRSAGGTRARMQLWLGADLLHYPQGGGDLGRRMQRAVADAFDAGKRSVVVIGSDCPGLTAGLLGRAFEALERRELVLGPARDGGYYLIGLRRPVPELLRGMDWGTERVLDQTVSAARRLGLSLEMLEQLDDVDRPDDLHVWERTAQSRGWLRPLAPISVVIPTLDESSQIDQVVRSAQSARNVDVTVVDGGSADGTVGLARSAGARVIRAPLGRAGQMNLGARHAAGEVLLFVHGDTLLPAGYDGHVRRALAAPDVAAGAFRFSIDGPGPALRRIERLTNARSRCLQMPYGDQGFFVRTRTFREVGGFPEMPIMEDYELVRRLRRRGRIVTVPVPARTSQRRWRTLGPIKTTLINQVMIAGYHLGVSPERLARWYGRRQDGLDR